MIAAGVVFHGKYIEHSMCQCCLGSHRQKTIVCRKTTEIPGPTYPKPDASMLLALENKR